MGAPIRNRDCTVQVLPRRPCAPASLPRRSLSLGVRQRIAGHMNEDINQEIVVELRKLKRVVYLILVFIIVGSVPAFYAGLTRGLSKADSWDQVTTEMR